MTENKNKTVYDFVAKRMKVHSSLELAELIDDFLKQCADVIYNLKVWPTNHGILCTELIFTCNYLIALSSRQTGNEIICSHIEMRRAEDLVLHTLHRVNQCICIPQSSSKARIPRRSFGDTVDKQLMQIISSLENPIIHFKGLAVMGHLLALSCYWCVCSKLIDNHAEEAFSCLTCLKQLASQSVLKEKLLLYHGLLLCSSIDENQDCDMIAPSIEELVSIVSVAWDKPSNLSLEYQPWKWICVCLDSKALMREKRYSQVMSQLCEILETDLDPEAKARILCLFADCYNKQGCHQLAIQTYRDALQVDNECCCVLWYLSSIYQNLGKSDLELECLNLLVSMLSEREGADQKQRYSCGFDEIVWSIFSPIKNTTLPMAMYTFAKRCFQLERYKEAAEQYFNLISKLQSQAVFAQQFIGNNFASVDIREVMVETAEALFMDRRLIDCLAISNHVCSCISVSDSLILPSQQSKSWDPFDDEEESPSSAISLDFPSSISPRKLKQSSFVGTKESVMPTLSVSEQLFGRELKKLTDLEELSQSRKRLRSNDASQVEESDTMKKKQLLKARALLCKSDALLMTEGFTDHSVACLSEALDVLLNQPCKPENKLNNSTHSPCLKRQRISSDTENNFLNQKQQKSENSSQDSHGPNSWMSLTLSTALRMGKASFERKRFPSVINSCLLALQLDTENAAAHFLKTLALSKHPATRLKSSIEWLQMRGINDFDDIKKLETDLQEKKVLQKKQIKVEERWWHASEKDFIDLDIECLQFLLESK